MVVGTIPLNPQISLSMSTGITMWYLRAYCNFVVKVVHDPTHPCPSAFSSKILSETETDPDLRPPTNITPFPSGDGAIALPEIP